MNMAVEYQENTKSFEDYIKTFKRRKKQFAIPTVVVFVIAVITAVLWPPTYKSSATILIEEQQIPKEFVASTVTSYAAQQIEVIKARIMTMQNIMDLVERYKLYTEDELRTQSRSFIVAEFIDDVGIDVLSAGVIDPRTGRPTEATIAFSLSYKHSSPAKAQKVASELSNLFLNENLKDRAQRSSSTSDFLKEEAAALSDELEKLETELETFKLANEGSLPELYQYNLQVMESTANQIRDINLRIKELEKSKLKLEAELVQISPYAPSVASDGSPLLSGYDRLKALKSEYRQKTAVYNEQHPDVSRLEREIQVLQEELGITYTPEEYNKQLREEKEKLAELNQKYTPDHPKVLAQQRVVDQLNDEKPKVTAAVNEQSDEAAPDNPAYVLLDTQLESVIVEIQIYKESQAELDKKLKKFEDFILKAPTVEKQYASLQRDYSNTQAKYQEIKAKQMSAELGQNLEQGRKGERFTLIDPPELPDEPVSPNKPAIIFLGFVFSLGLGGLVVVMLEALSPVVRGKAEVANILGIQPLVAIPYINNDEENIVPSHKWLKIGLALFALGIIGLVAFHFMIKPLDVTWFILQRKLGI